jgi:hypothetical protein
VQRLSNVDETLHRPARVREKLESGSSGSAEASNYPRGDGLDRHSSCRPKRLLIQENARVPTPMTVHVATVRHKASVPVNSQIARIDAPTAMKMQIAVIQNENLTFDDLARAEASALSSGRVLKAIAALGAAL